MDVDAFGAFTGYIGLLYLTVSVADFGVAGYSQRSVAANQQNLSTIVTLFRRTLCRTLPAFLVITAAASAALGVWSALSIIAVLLGAVWIVIALISGVMNAALVGDHQFGLAALRQGLGRLIAITLMAIIVLVAPAHGGAALLFSSLIVGESITIFFYLPRFTKSSPTFEPRFEPVPAKTLVPYAANNLAVSVYTRGDVPVLLFAAGAAAAGAYAPFSQMQTVLLTLPSLAAAGVTAVVARSAATGSDDVLSESRRQINVLSFGLAVVSLGIAVIGAALAPWVVHTVFGQAFHDGLIPWILFLSVPIACFHLVFAQAMIAIGKVAIVTRAVVISTVVGSLLMLALSWRLGAVGAAAAVVGRDLLLAVFVSRQWFALSD